MKILAIDTSCDDTCASIIKIQNYNSKVKNARFEILSNVVSSQIKIHQEYGGVVPGLAKREHQQNLIPVIKKALRKANLLIKLKNKAKVKTQTEIQNKELKKILKKEEYLYNKLKTFLQRYQKPRIDLIAVTMGPGLEPALFVGINFAKAISFIWQKPIVPVNHLKAHIFANWLTLASKKINIQFPILCLVASGGHTELFLMKNYKNFKLLGETRDDAAGECLDKVAKTLGFPYPGGPIIEKNALLSKLKTKIILPRPMIYQKNYDFSFSGLKTAVLYLTKKLSKNKTHKIKSAICKEVQQAIIDVLLSKTIRAAKKYRVKTILLGGGVISNKELKKQFKKNYPLAVIHNPPSKFCTDNAAMVGIAGYFDYINKKTFAYQKIKAKANLKVSKTKKIL